MTADGTYATQSALCTPGVMSLARKDEEKRFGVFSCQMELMKLKSYFAFLKFGSC